MFTDPAILIAIIGTFLIGILSTVAGALVVLPPAQNQPLPWWERARRTYPARLAPVISAFLVGQILIPVTGVYFGIMGFRPPTPMFVTIALLPFIGTTTVAIFMSCIASPRHKPIWYWFGGCISALLMRFPNTLVCGVLSCALFVFPHDLSSVLFVLFIGAIAIGFIAWGGGVLVARMLGLAYPALPRAQHAADWAAERVGIRPTAVFEITWPIVRVDAYIFSRYLVFTDAAATHLSDEELFALATREITFFQQPRLAGTLRIIDSTAIYFLLACSAIGATISRQAMLTGAMITVVIAFLMRPFYRRAQLKADALAASAAIDPAAALRAMTRQYELNLHPVVAVSNRSPDAHLYDRLVKAGLQPEYPRPAPPSRGRILLSVVTAAGSCLLLSLAFLVAIGVTAH
jgi:hypothetical protein